RRRGQRDDDAGRRYGHHRPLPLFRAAGGEAPCLRKAMSDALPPPRTGGLGERRARFALYGALAAFAAYYLPPLGQMISTPLNSLDEIGTGSLISLPRSITFQAWGYAWGEACIGTECNGLGLHFLNSIKFVLPAVAISSALGAINGYALTKFRFPGAN